MYQDTFLNFQKKYTLGLNLTNETFYDFIFTLSFSPLGVCVYKVMGGGKFENIN